jgi:hypothetical protein
MDRPINRVNLFNSALPVGGNDILVAAITPTLDPGTLKIYIVPSITGKLSVARTVGGVTVTELLNAGADLAAGTAYTFIISWKAGESLNIRFSSPVIGASTCVNGTGTCTGSPITLVAMVTTVVVTGAGNFTVTLAAGLTGIAASGTATVVGSPKALAAGANTVDTGATTGNFTITINGSLSKLQIDESWG